MGRKGSSEGFWSKVLITNEKQPKPEVTIDRPDGTFPLWGFLDLKVK
jgi:hypothetical protein